MSIHIMFQRLRAVFAPVGAAFLLAMSTHQPAFAEPAPPEDAAALITQELVAQLREVVDNELVQLSIRAQNAKYGALSDAQINTLDQQWRAEREMDDKPLIAMTLSNPLSNYLIRSQADALGLYAAIFVTDANGLNVGQSAITGDYWQGDEAKFQRTFPVGPTAVFIDEPEYAPEFGVWIVQVNMTIADKTSGAPIGAVTFDVNLEELRRRAALAAN